MPTHINKRAILSGLPAGNLDFRLELPQVFGDLGAMPALAVPVAEPDAEVPTVLPMSTSTFGAWSEAAILFRRIFGAGLRIGAPVCLPSEPPPRVRSKSNFNADICCSPCCFTQPVFSLVTEFANNNAKHLFFDKRYRCVRATQAQAGQLFLCGISQPIVPPVHQRSDDKSQVSKILPALILVNGLWAGIRHGGETRSIRHSA
ncbi:MAG: hypothetical protein ABJM26_14755 [Anderseniella sp.]